MAGDFFLGFAAHAHTRSDLVPDPNVALQLRRENRPEEALSLTEVALDKIEEDILRAGYNLKDLRLIVLYLSYRGDSEQKDRLISETILKAIEKRFKSKAGLEQLRLIGHTTAGEIENYDLVLQEPSGIGYNGLTLLAFVTNLPIGIGRTRGMRTAEEATAQGKMMVRDAWIDINQSELKGHVQKSKALLVLTKGSNIGKFGYEYFMTEGIAEFISSTREARIASVLGGCSGDGIIGRNMHQYYCKFGGQSELQILDNEAVCALIPIVNEPSIGLDLAPVRQVGESHTFHFDPDAEPKYKFLKRIGAKDPREVYARTIYENEARIARERGLPEPNEKELFEQISEIDGIPLNLTLAKYTFSFPFGNYAPMSVLKVKGSTVELLQPIRSHDSSIPGRIVILDHGKVQNGAWNVVNMLRENRGFGKNDITLLITCVSRRLVEMIAGCTSNTEAQIFKETFSSTQVAGFLAYGELSFTNLLQEPYIYTCSCWGMTLRSKLDGTEGGREKKTAAFSELSMDRVDESLSFEFQSEAAQKTFAYVVGAFINDYMRQKLSLEESGWRTLVDTIKQGGVPKSSVYSASGGIGSAISELEKRGLIEVRFFSGERGRGGRILKIRLSYEKEIIKRYVDRLVMKK
ncbi:MAG: hypothetical protein NWE94_08285 [Candidatus Bathyarchaeota archaeon]|nr:hypothetical protein [Candidatus Bathyarchaeota archaeon]